GEPLQLGGALCAPVELVSEAMLKALAELAGGDLLRPMPEGMGDVVARDHQVAPVVPDAPHQQVNMWAPGVVMLGRDPVDPRAEVALDPLHQVAGVGFHALQLAPIFGGEDDAEMMPVALAALDEAGAVGAVQFAIEHGYPLAVAARAVALDVKRVTHH